MYNDYVFKKLPEVYKFWIILAIATTFLSLLMCVIVQQTIRQSANDPQIQIADDTASKLAGGKDPDQLIVQSKVDLATSLDIFMIVYSAKGEPIFSTAILENNTPELPMGVLEYAKIHPIHKLTWQPKDSVRISTVVKYFKGEREGFVLVGRSLREVENRKAMVQQQAILGWAATLVATFLAALFITKTGKA